MASAEDFADRRARRYFEKLGALLPRRTAPRGHPSTYSFVQDSSLSSPRCPRSKKQLEKKQKEFIKARQPERSFVLRSHTFYF